MNINPGHSRNFLIVTPDAIVGMDLVGIVSSVFPQSKTRVAQQLSDVMADIKASGPGTTVLVAARLVSREAALELNAGTMRGVQVIVMGEAARFDRDYSFATVLDEPFTTASVLDVIHPRPAT